MKIKKKGIYKLFLIGIDEAGRGPLAGPIVVGGVMLAVQNRSEERKIFASIRDSKKLTPPKRENWLKFIKNHTQVTYARAIISPAVIDKINISQAALLGAEKVYQKLLARAVWHNPQKIITRLDGGLRLKNAACETIIKGDEKIPVIAAASIVAKTCRDNLMLNWHKKYPLYGFDKHKGYGTLRHREALRKFGACQIHRRSFTFR